MFISQNTKNCIMVKTEFSYKVILGVGDLIDTNVIVIHNGPIKGRYIRMY